MRKLKADGLGATEAGGELTHQPGSQGECGILSGTDWSDGSGRTDWSDRTSGSDWSRKSGRDLLARPESGKVGRRR